MAIEVITIRSYDEQIDRARVEDFERRCEVGPANRAILLTDNMGDPICRIRNSPLYNMLVAEVENEIVGVVRGTIKVVSLQNPTSSSPSRAKVGYILGLRVSGLHRRRGIATELVRKLEAWFAAHSVDYAYMATEKANVASARLFIDKLGFHKFRTPSVLVNPVGRPRPLKISSGITITKIEAEEAAFLYRKFMGSAEFFPQDIEAILRNKHCLGTWVARPRAENWNNSSSSSSSSNSSSSSTCDGLIEPNYPMSWAMASLWNSAEIFKLKLGKAPLIWRLYSKGSRWTDRVLPWLKPLVPLVPNIFEPFGFYFMYGVHEEGPLGGKLVKHLCKFVHEMAARERRECKAIVTEIGACSDALRTLIPHSKWLSCPEDLWCIKALNNNNGHNITANLYYDLMKTTPEKPLFVDPREV